MILALISFSFACSGQKGNTDVNNDKIEKILMSGDKFSNDDIELLLNYLESDKNTNLKKEDIILSSLKNYNTKMDSSQKTRFENAEKAFQKKNGSIINPPDYKFNKDTLDNNLKCYLKANGYNIKDLNTEKLATQSLKIFVKEINSRYEKRVPADKFLTTKEINYLAGPSGLLAYYYDRMINAKDSKTKIAYIAALQILTEIFNAATWEDKNVRMYRWFESFKVDYDTFIKEKK